jgi:hypothetical protein
MLLLVSVVAMALGCCCRRWCVPATVLVMMLMLVIVAWSHFRVLSANRYDGHGLCYPPTQDQAGKFRMQDTIQSYMVVSLNAKLQTLHT